jgi:hypothetical protein
MRTSRKRLESLVERINRITDSPLASWTKGNDGKLTSNIGNFRISGAYGGVSLHRMENKSGGVSDVFGCGHVPKRQLDDMMCAFIKGLEA